MRRLGVKVLMLLSPIIALPYPAVAADVSNRFFDVRIDPPYDLFLQANPLLMEYEGAKIIMTADGRKMIVSVGSTEVKDDTAADRLRRVKVCRSRAMAHILRETEAVQIVHETRYEDRVDISIEKGSENGKSVASFFDLTTSQVRGAVQAMPVVGSWYSGDRKVFYLAVGGPIQSEDADGTSGAPLGQEESGLPH